MAEALRRIKQRRRRRRMTRTSARMTIPEKARKTVGTKTPEEARKKTEPGITIPEGTGRKMKP